MELKEFIKRTLVDIIDGVKDGQEATKNTGAIIAPQYSKGQFHKIKGVERCVYDIEFEVGLSLESLNEGKGKIAVEFGLLGIGGAKKATTNERAITGIKFTIPVALPIGDSESK